MGQLRYAVEKCDIVKYLPGQRPRLPKCGDTRLSLSTPFRHHLLRYSLTAQKPVGIANSVINLADAAPVHTSLMSLRPNETAMAAKDRQQDRR